MTTEEKLKHFEESSLENAREQATQIISEHKTALEKIKTEHVTAKKRQAALQIKTETESLKRANNMALSKEQLQIKREITKKHNELKEKLFVEVKAMLEDYMSSPAYDKLLVNQMHEIKEIAGEGKVIIYIDPADSSKQLSLGAATNEQVSLSEYSFMGGTRAVLADRHILIDNSFATKLEEAKAEFTFDGGMTHD